MKFQKIFLNLILGASALVLLIIGTQISNAGNPEKMRIDAVSIFDQSKTDIGLGERLLVKLVGPIGSGQNTDKFKFSKLILYLDGRPLVDHHPVVEPRPAALCIEKVDAIIKPLLEQQKTAVAAPQSNEEEIATRTKLIASANQRLKAAREQKAACGDMVNLIFQLERNQGDEKSRKVWSALLGGPKTLNRTVDVGVGLLNGDRLQPKEGLEPKITLEMLGGSLLTAAILMFAAALFAFLFMWNRSNVIRAPVTVALADNERPPYSLGKTQMAWWFFLVLGSYLFIAVSTFNFETMSAQALILIGIAAATGLGAIAIDSAKSDASNTELVKAEKEIETLSARETELAEELKRLKAIAKPTTEQSARIVSISEEVAVIPAAKRSLQDRIAGLEGGVQKRVSKNFRQDLVSDGNGVSFHRFQNVVWSIVLGGVFVFQVWTNLAMPEFSATLLTLMGITSGTYLGFKFPEKA